MMDSNARAFDSLFPQKSIPLILSSIIEAGRTLHKKTSNDKEDRLTRRLCSRLIQLPIFRDGPLGIHPQQEILSSDPDADNPAGRIDILVSCGLGFEVYFAIEAKRLRVPTSQGQLDLGNDEYVNKGMMRFVSGQYAPLMNSGGMLGYVFDGDTSKVRSDIQRYIQSKRKELKMKVPGEFTRSKIVPDESIDETFHELTERTFTLYHIFLSV